MASMVEGQKNDFIFHFVCLLINAVGCSYELMYIRIPFYNTYGGRFKFLTHWSQYLHLLYFCFALPVFLFSLISLGPLIKKDQNGKQGIFDCGRVTAALLRLRDTFFVSICFPGGMMVCFLFWGITIATKDDGLTSEETRKIVPLFSFYNHYLHTAPLFLNLGGIFFVKFNYPERKYGITIVSGFSVLYIAWLVHVGNHTGFWTYPFIEHQTTMEFVIFLIGSVLATIIVYISGELLSSLIWGKDETKQVKVKWMKLFSDHCSKCLAY